MFAHVTDHINWSFVFSLISSELAQLLNSILFAMFTKFVYRTYSLFLLWIFYVLMVLSSHVILAHMAIYRRMGFLTYILVSDLWTMYTVCSQVTSSFITSSTVVSFSDR